MTTLSYALNVILAIVVIALLSAISAPQPPRVWEIQQALDNYAFMNGLCPAYSQLTIHPDGTWTCQKK